MNSNWKLLPAALLVAVLALAGCGGGSDPEPVEPPGQSADELAAMQRTAIGNAIDAAETAVASVNDEATAATVQQATSAIMTAKQAIAAAANVPAEEKASNTRTVAALESRLSAALQSRMDAMDAQAAEDQKDMTAKAKALKSAIEAWLAIAAADRPDVTTSSLPAFDSPVTDAIDLSKDEDVIVAALGNWMGTHYAGTEGSGEGMSAGMLRRYTNQDAAKQVRFDSSTGNAIHGLTIANGAVADIVSDSGFVATRVGGAIVPGVGQDSHDVGDEIDGTYFGAAGEFECTAGTCTATRTATGGVTLAGTWSFTPSAGAMLMQTDPDYLYFGWWLRQDNDGDPTHAGTIYGSATTNLAAFTGVDAAALVGKASYVGKAAGKFAVSDPLRPADDNAGHFTANAELNADFKATGSTLSGTIDAFRLNDGSADPGWSIELQEAAWSTNQFATGDTPDGDQTVWSINGNKGAASGSWQAQLYDEVSDDGSNVPTSVVGGFNSSIGNTHSMVGAFGAEKE